MAPADAHGYRLLPQDDIETAGGPLGPAARSRTKKAKAEPPKSVIQELCADEFAHTHAAGMKEREERYEQGVRFDYSMPPCVVHPFNPVVQAWGAMLVFVLIVDIVFLPIETAFGRVFPQLVLFWFNLVSTVLFSMDLGLQFFLQIMSDDGNYWVFNHRKIVVSYLHGYFIIDCLSVLPLGEFHEVYMLYFRRSGQRINDDFVMHVLRYVKLLRMLRLQRIFRRYQFDNALTYAQSAMVSCLGRIIFTIHLMSCLWATMGNYQVGRDWLSELKRGKDSVMGEKLWKGLDGSVMDCVMIYVTSVYFAFCTLTGIGYGDIGPTTCPEYMYVICIMLLGSVIWATIIGEIVSVIRNANIDELDYHETMDHLVKMNKQYKISPELRSRLHEYLLQSRNTSHQAFVRDKIISCMSAELAIELVFVLQGSWLEQVWWLKNVNRTAFMVQLSLKFEPMLYCPHEVIRATDRLFVVTRGLCMHGAQVLVRDKCWGVDMLLHNNDLRGNFATVTLSYLHVLYLTRDALYGVMDRFPREKQLVRRAYRSLVLMRGIMWHARKLLAEERRSQHRRDGVTSADSRGQEDYKKVDFLTYMGFDHSEVSRQARKPSLRLDQPVLGQEARETEIKATEETLQSVRDARDQLQELEVEMDRRLGKVESQVQEALNDLTSFIASKRAQQQRGSWAKFARRENSAG